MRKLSWERKRMLLWRWAVTSAVWVASFWVIWYLTIPTVSTVEIGPGVVLQELPISRWWLVFGLIWPSICILSVSNKILKRYAFAFIDTLGLSLIFGLVAGLLPALGAPRISGLLAVLGSGAFFGLLGGWGSGLIVVLGASLGSGLGFGLTFGLVVNPVSGLAAGLVVGLGVGLAVTLDIVLVKLLFARRT